MNKFYKDVHEMQLDAIKDWWLLHSAPPGEGNCS